MDNILKSLDIYTIINIAKEAGTTVMSFYDSNIVDINLKNDMSPLTQADISSHDIITNRLKEITPKIPIISEEGNLMTYDERKSLKYFWLIDPLDGTKEFLKKNGEFTINISLIRNNTPILGIIYAPALTSSRKNTFNTSDLSKNMGVIYYGYEGIGSFKIENEQTPSVITIDKDISEGLIVVQSRSHSNIEEDQFYKSYNIKDVLSKGSSLKFCLVAEGKAHLYYRSGPTNEWDTAAGHAIAKYSGAHIYGLYYNKPNILNQSFVVSSFIIKELE